MKFIPITDVCEFQGGTQPPKSQWSKEPSSDNIRMLQIRDFTQSDKDHVEYVKKSKKLKTCESEDILIGRYGASIGKILTGLSGAYNVAIVKTIPDSEHLTKQFLYHFLRSPIFRNFIQNIAARAAQAGFNKSDLSRFKIPIISLNSQIRIATLLNRVEALITARKDNLHLLDEFLKNTFLEMFGDPMRNEKGWDIDNCHKVVLDIKSGTSYGGDDRSILKDNEMGVLKISAVTQGYFNKKEIKAVSIHRIKKQVISVKKGDFLVSRANTIEL